MSEPLVVDGTLEAIKNKLINISNVIQNRAVLGYPLLQSDERWEYHTQQNKSRVCYICAPLDNTVLTGIQLGTFFPSLEFLGDGVVHPHTHHGTEIKAECYCSVVLLNTTEIVEVRLHQEKLQVV